MIGKVEGMRWKRGGRDEDWVHLSEWTLGGSLKEGRREDGIEDAVLFTGLLSVATRAVI